jgi:hypothetical protein
LVVFDFAATETRNGFRASAEDNAAVVLVAPRHDVRHGVPAVHYFCFEPKQI